MSLGGILSGRPVVLCHIDLIQDLDVLLPVILAARDDSRLRFRVVVSRWLETTSPRVARILGSHAIRFHYVARRDVAAERGPSLWGVAAILTASESDQPTHTAGHALAKRANARGIPTFTLQHGLDSLGGDVRFASDRVFSWFVQDGAPNDLDETTRDKLLPVGRPLLRARSDEVEFDVGVFENLHADVYSEMERARFVDQLGTVLNQRPNISFYIRTHPAGRWLESLSPQLANRSNVTFVPAAASLASMSPGYHEAGRCERVITTPSTVALDALFAGRPVALALRGGAPYDSLPVLADIPAWLDFVDGGGEAEVEQGGSHLLDTIVTEGDPACRILNHMVDASSCQHASRLSSRKAI